MEKEIETLKLMKTHGGKRKGAGRKREKGRVRKRSVTLSLTPGAWKKLDDVAWREQKSLSAVVEAWLIAER